MPSPLHSPVSFSRYAGILVFCLCALSFREAPAFHSPALSSHQAAGRPSEDSGSSRQAASPAERDLTVSYSIEVRSRKKNTGKGEAYNGGAQTLFISGEMARVRLVSLMRTQSIFILPGDDSLRTAAIIRETGKSKYKYYLTAKQWKAYNGRYTGADCHFLPDTATILRYPCRKALITLHQGRSITVFYTPSIRHPGIAAAEPAFACIPGLVLRYEYTVKKGTVVYTATQVNRTPIDAGVFSIPSRGYTLKEYSH